LTKVGVEPEAFDAADALERYRANGSSMSLSGVLDSTARRGKPERGHIGHPTRSSMSHA
jgi:hypothetical protein